MTSDSQWAAKLCAERGNLLSFQFGQKSWNLGTVCGNSARTDLWGKRWATGASTRKITLKSYVTKKEYCQIKQLAKQTGFSVSEYIRRILNGQRIESRLDQEAFLSALKVNADLGRLGGLFKYYLAQGFKNVPPSEIRKVLHDIEDRQRQLRPVISKIRDMV